MVKVNVGNWNKLNENDAKQAFTWRGAFGRAKNGARERIHPYSPLALLLSSHFFARPNHVLKETLPTVSIYDPCFCGISTGFESKKAWKSLASVRYPKWTYIPSKFVYPRVRAWRKARGWRTWNRLPKTCPVFRVLNLPGVAWRPRKIRYYLSKECCCILFKNTSAKSKLIDKASQFGPFNKSEEMSAMPMQARPQGITFDEYGRPFIILKEQERQKRLTGLDAQKVKCVNYC